MTWPRYLKPFENLPVSELNRELLLWQRDPVSSSPGLRVSLYLNLFHPWACALAASLVWKCPRCFSLGHLSPPSAGNPSIPTLEEPESRSSAGAPPGLPRSCRPLPSSVLTPGSRLSVSPRPLSVLAPAFVQQGQGCTRGSL